MTTTMNLAPTKPFHVLLRDTRVAYNWSIHDCAERARCSEREWRRFEDGRARPTKFQVKRVFGGDCPLVRQLPREPGEQEELEIAPSGALVEPDPPAAPRASIAALSPAEVFRPRSFGEALRAARLAENIEQYALAELLGVAKTTVSTWEADTSVPVREHYEKLRDLLPGLAFGPVPPSRDIAKPAGNPAGVFGKAPRGPDTRPRAPMVGKIGVVIVAPPEPDAELPALPAAAPEPPRRAPDGLELLARAIKAADRLWGDGHRAWFIPPADGKPWTISLSNDGFIAESAHSGTGSSCRLALASLLDVVHAEIERRRRVLDDLTSDLPRETES